MSEMVERVALAISGGDDPASILAIHRSRARAAIKAMREPTPEMLDAFYCTESGRAPRPLDHWKAMIAAALR